ncbi:MAG: hypothetical protein CL623_09045 [Arcobacter sp.]|nr:hypothetical protein [Arcobacter sp.]
MKRLTTTIIGLSLLAGSALSAEEKFASFYPVEDNDTPSYLLSNTHDSKAYQTLAKVSTVEDNVFASFYPIENSDTPDYLVSFSDNKGEVFQTLAKSGIQHCTLTAFYPEEGLDTRVQTSC